MVKLFSSWEIIIRKMKTESGEKYFDLRGFKWQEISENCIMRNFITCTLRQV
jgi:hypothetical protein